MSGDSVVILTYYVKVSEKVPLQKYFPRRQWQFIMGSVDILTIYSLLLRPHMFTIIHPSQFKTLPWKNGKGETIELAINDSANLNEFEWRMSMASVVEDGVFSDFSGYMRNLVLIEGKGLNLQHDHNHIDKLNNLLDVATFDGGCSTVGNLHNGSITDFNIITAKEKYKTQVGTYLQKIKLKIELPTLCFIYSLSADTAFSIDNDARDEILPQGHLLKVSQEQASLLNIEGEQIIVVELSAV